MLEEFKGSATWKYHLDRKLTDKRVFPSIDMQKSRTGREELLLARGGLDRSGSAQGPRAALGGRSDRAPARPDRQDQIER